MSKSKFVKLSGWLALLTGVVGVLALVTLILFFVGFFQNIHFLLPMGSLNDKLNAVAGFLSAGLALALVPILHKSPLRLSLILLIGVWAGASAVAYGSWLIVTGRSGLERSSYFYFFGNGLIGIWVWTLNRIARQQTIWLRNLTRAGTLAGIFMMTGLLALYGILLGSDGSDYSPLVMVSGLSYVGIGILYPIWCIRLGGMILSKSKYGNEQQGFR